MQEPNQEEVRKAMIEGDYQIGLFVKFMPQTLLEKSIQLRRYDITMYSTSNTDVSTMKFQIQGALRLDRLLQQAEKPAHEEPLQGVAMYRKVPSLLDAFSQ